MRPEGVRRETVSAAAVGALTRRPTPSPRLFLSGTQPGLEGFATGYVPKFGSYSFERRPDESVGAWSFNAGRLALRSLPVMIGNPLFEGGYTFHLPVPGEEQWVAVANNSSRDLRIGYGTYALAYTSQQPESGAGFAPRDLVGEARVPVKVYKDDSLPISVNLWPSSGQSNAIFGGVDGTVQARKIDFRDVFLANHAIESSLEVELDAPAFKCQGDSKQRQYLSQQKLSYIWNCEFITSGRDLVTTLVFRRITPYAGDAGYLLQSLDYPITVLKLGPLTEGQIWILTGTFAAISSVLGILKLVKELRTGKDESPPKELNKSAAGPSGS